MSKLILRGQSPEIKLPVTVKMPDGTDTFTAVFKRGDKGSFESELNKAKNKELSDDEFLNKWLVRVDDLYNGATEKTESWEAVAAIPVFLESLPYLNALVESAWTAIRNTEIERQRLGN